MMKRALLIFLIGTAAGCATVHPSQREMLADPVMRPELAEDAEAMRQDIHEVREGSRGGLSLDGAGCGCN